jgi:CheY-like chemotaxis protein
MAPYLVVVEDDHLQEGPLQDKLEEAFPDARVEAIPTERAFRDRLDDLRSRRPDLVVMDVMLRWDLPSRDAPDPPPEVVAGGYQRAGLRCAELMAADPALAAVPVVFWTILEHSDIERDGRTLPARSRYLRKSPDLDLLIRTARELARLGRG